MQQKATALPVLRISAATTELVKGILVLEELYPARDQIHALVIQLQAQYDILSLASAFAA